MTRATPTTERRTVDYLGHLHTAATLLAGTLGGGDLEVPVPACPGWTLRDLGVHVAGAHHWARGAILDGHPRTPAPEPPAGSGAAELAEWYLGHATALRRTLLDTDPGAACWTFGPKPSTVAFWHRRQAHETMVHAWDADPTAPVDGGLALDGIDEVVEIFFPRQVRLLRTPPLSDSLAVEPNPSPADVTHGHTAPRWVLAGDGLPPRRESSTPADATVSGPADALYLLLWGRISLADSRIGVSGDAGAARRVLAGSIVP